MAQRTQHCKGRPGKDYRSNKSNGRGIPEEIAKTVVIAKWNDTTALEKVVKRNAADPAAIIMEPVLGSSGVILPDEDYLKSVREIADNYDVLLIFDEVLTGFRLAPGGAQEFYGVKPDLSCLALT